MCGVSVDWKEFFNYDENSISCLTWAVEVRSGKNGCTLSKQVGELAGGMSARGYYTVMAAGNVCRVHRVIWEMHNGPIPVDMIVDHINGKPLDNRLCNLRMTTQETNARNRRKASNNTSGIQGVRYMEHKGGQYWTAYWAENRRQKSRYFNIAKMGNDVAFAAACAAREAGIAAVGGYSDRHGL